MITPRRESWARPFSRGWGYPSAGRMADGAAADVPYFPGTLPGWQLGLDADYAYTDAGGSTLATTAGQQIYTLADLSGNARHAQQATLAKRPKWSRIGGHGSLSFDFTQILATGSFLGSGTDTAITVYLVCEPAITSSNLDVMMNFGAAGPLFMGRNNQSSSRDVADIFTGNLSTSGNRYTTWTGGNRMIFAMRYNGTTRRRAVITDDGTTLETDEATTGNLGASGAVFLGNTADGAGFGYCGMIQALHVYSNAHAEASYDAMIASLLAKWCTTPAAGTLSSGAGQKLVAFSGNSLVAGDQGGGTTIPGLLQTNLGGSWTVSNLGVSGYTTGRLNSLDQERVDLLFSSSSAKAVACLWEGTNDGYFTSGLESAKRRIRDWCLRRKAAGWYVIVGTLLPRTDAGTPGGWATFRTDLNTWILANYASFAHAVCDVGNHASLQNTTDGVNFAADKVHLTAAGYTIAEVPWRTAILAA